MPFCNRYLDGVGCFFLPPVLYYPHTKGVVTMDSKAKRILTLFLTFFKIGAFTFGGGYAMIHLI